MQSRIDWIDHELASLKEAGLYKTIRTISSPQGPWLEVDGKHVLNFCSNNYLGLANEPRMVQAAKKALDQYGVGPAAVRPLAGTLDLHLELERRLAKFKGVESAITFQSGYCANLAVIPTLVGKEDLIISDELNHASIIDGCRLSGARVLRYSHADPEDLERIIIENEGNCRRALAITDGVFSMDGDIAPLDQICRITNAHGVMLLVDDAHGEGVIGRGGRGIVDHFNLHGQVDVEVGTFSKAFGVVGGVVAGNSALVDLIRQRGRPFTFSSAVTPTDAAATLAAVDILEESTDLVEHLWENGRYFKGRMKDLGFDTGLSQTPITPVILKDALLAQEFSKCLFDENVFATSIGYPIVARDKARIRVMISACHTRDDLDLALGAFAKVGKQLGIIS